MTKQFSITKDLDSGFGNEAGVAGNTTIDLSDFVDEVRQKVSKSPNKVNMPKSRTNWSTSLPETRVYDFKKINHELTVTGNLAGSSATTTKNKIIAFIEAGGAIDSLSWNDETFTLTGNTLGGYWLTNADFVDNESELEESSLDSNEVKYNFTLVFVRAIEPT